MNLRTCLLLLCLIFLASCQSDHKKLPNVDHLKSDLKIVRFDEALFQLDTNALSPAIAALQAREPAFSKDYFYGILGLPPVPDSVVAALGGFLRAYRPIYQQVRPAFSDLRAEKKELDQALRYCQHYFPQYKVPQRLIAYLGPLDGFGNVLTSSGFAVGLQLYMGPRFAPYQTDYFREFYPDYRSRRFARNHLTADCLRNLINDLHPALPAGRSLLEQMVDAGKRLYVLDYLLPKVADTVKIGYTARQLQGCRESEANIWNFFLQNNLLYATDPALVRDYVNDGPQTAAFGPDSPGNIAAFNGWQMVKAWAGKMDVETDLQRLLNTPAQQLLKESGYKPR